MVFHFLQCGVCRHEFRIPAEDIRDPRNTHCVNCGKLVTVHRQPEGTASLDQELFNLAAPPLKGGKPVCLICGAVIYPTQACTLAGDRQYHSTCVNVAVAHATDEAEAERGLAEAAQQKELSHAQLR
jgi:hypothetical protein